MRTELAGARWRTSRRSGQQGNCVQVADDPAGVVGVRDSKDVAGPVLAFDRPAWAGFVAAVKRDAFGR